ncbi:hypothetical protein LUZ60_015082 [Juncus effusus]|nr:hypothetical protein LUZ60_015082 [Juncus effusus]
MGSIGGVISSLSSFAAKLLPGRGSSSSSTSDEGPGIEEEINKLMRMLERLKATLYDAEERETRGKSVNLWLKELKEIVYTAEDILSEYRYEVLRAEVEAGNASSENSRKRKKLELPEGVADRIKKTIDMFNEIANHRDTLQLREDDGPRLCNDEMHATPTSSLGVESNIFGRGNDKEKLINLLRSDNNSNGDVISVVSIVGMGGLGKTTVAQLVYNDLRIRHKFDLFGWVCVSDDFSVGRLTKEVVESIRGGSCDVNNLSVLQENLRKEIKGKSFFLVLDDVWNEKRSVWELFQTPFLSAKLVKILVTTRNEPVARIMQTFTSFKLQHLYEEQCWQLFCQYAFGGANCNEEWKLEIGKQIMKKCGRLPLAVKSIASLLRHEESEESWREILESELWELEATKEIFPPLQISYSRLPTYLKPCLLYCSMFPKDYIYYMNEMTPLWYAQGYIESREKKTINEIGMEYAKQLFERSFFEGKLPTKDWDWFRLHDMIHDLAQSNSGNECYSIEYGKPLISPKQIRHLYVKDSDELIKPFPSSPFNTLRTTIMANSVENVTNISDILEARSLRAIVFKPPCYEFRFLNTIGNLKHLRYISIEYITFEKLPESICSLYNLQTLTLSNCPKLIELPKCIGNLVSLQFLSISECLVSKLPESICHLRNLKALTVKTWDDAELTELPEHIGNLVRLEELHLKTCSIAILRASLCQLKSLKTLDLKLYWKHPREIESLRNFQTLTVTEASSLLPKLNKLAGIQILNLEFTLTMRNNYNDQIGCLNDIVDIKGALFITGLHNIKISLADTKHYSLMNKHNLEYLSLSWHDEDELDYPVSSSRFILFIGNDTCYGDDKEMNFVRESPNSP